MRGLKLFQGSVLKFESVKDEIRQVSCLVCRDKETAKKPITQNQRSGILGLKNWIQCLWVQKTF